MSTSMPEIVREVREHEQDLQLELARTGAMLRALSGRRKPSRPAANGNDPRQRPE